MEKNFKSRHPVAFGILIVTGIFVLIWSGVSLLFSLIPGIMPSESLSQRPRHGEIGVVEIKGEILTPEKIIAALTDFRKNRKIKAIVLRVDSPGGAVGASQEIFNEVIRTDRKKPVVASLGSVAASGGFYAAIGARKIIASPGTITGSIGVIVKFANLQEIFKKIGYRPQVIKSGKLKDLGSMSRPMTTEERRLLQGIIDNVHLQFVADVAKSRKLAEKKVRAIADGRIFSGQQARDLGLVDGLGNFTNAVELAARLAGIKSEYPRLAYPRQKKFSILNLVAGEEASFLKHNPFSQGPLLSYEWPGP